MRAWTARNPYRALDRVLMAEVRKEDEAFVINARKEYLKSAIEAMRADLASDKAFGLSKEWAPADLALLRSCYRDKADILAKYERELRGLSRPVGTGRARLTEEQMQQAREFPITQLLDGKKEGDLMLCPAHDDTRDSLHIYKDRVHCYSCGFHANSVGWMMKTRDMTFIEAVRDLIS